MKALNGTHEKSSSDEQPLPSKGQMTWVAFLWMYTTINACGGLDPGYQGEILVSQSPPYLRVVAGDNVVMHCNFSLQGNVTLMFIGWNQERQRLIECVSKSKDCRLLVQRKINASVNWRSQISMLQIRNIEPKDNGTYYCEIQVEKPAPVRRGYGNGTALDVTEPEEASAESSRVLQTLLPGLLASGLVFCLLCSTYSLYKGKPFTAGNLELPTVSTSALLIQTGEYQIRPEGLLSGSPSNNQGVDHFSKSAEDNVSRLDPGILQPVYISTPAQQPARSSGQAIYSEI
ncbi:uncharacterized protein LOC134347327 [Mobula hypostoma]|uniref:uncharacterized protein LOC134347327 n=1 Tax=Mobula hypostoma TaxID=723540 RepID=UPI002FC33CB6